MRELAEAHRAGHPGAALECVQRSLQFLRAARIARRATPAAHLLAGLRVELRGFLEEDRQHLFVDVVADAGERIVLWLRLGFDGRGVWQQRWLCGGWRCCDRFRRARGRRRYLRGGDGLGALRCDGTLFGLPGDFVDKSRFAAARLFAFSIGIDALGLDADRRLAFGNLGRYELASRLRLGIDG